MATAPFEIIAAPFEVYLAPVGEAFPNVGNTPAGNWALLGTSGSKNYTEDGIVVTHEQTIEVFRPLGLTAARKAFRTEEMLTIAFEMKDISAAQYAKVMNNATVTNTAGGGGTAPNLNLPLLQGLGVSLFALLLKGAESAGGNNFNTQYDVPIVFQNGNPEVTYQKGEPAGLACEFVALWDSSAGFGRYRSQTGAVS